ncbi:MAG: protein kinase [Acidobacteria bacterium]|nr:protein kinase [Acidobacteriota bacterium]
MIEAGQAIGPYRILSQLGAGGMGEVYLAEDTRLKRRVAIKILPPHLLKDGERRKRFLREARAAAAVDHPNIVHIYEVEEDPERGIYLVMQHVDGTNVREALRMGAMPFDRALGVAMEVADALAAAHGLGIVHRDIKPDNVMLDTGGHARLLDFGLARALEAGGALTPFTEMNTADQNVTAPGAVMGTTAYMSPEQARGADVDARSDIFSFGVTLYEMVAGRHPFAGRTSVETIDSLLNREPQPIGTLVPAAPSAMEWVISKMLAKDREERYQTAKEVLADLRKVRQSTSGQGQGASRPREESPGRGRALLPKAAIAVGLLVASAAVNSWLKRQDAPNLPPPGPSPAGQAIPGSPAAAAPQMKIAVLPLQNVRKDARIDFLGFALADAVISKLTYLDAVTVRPSAYVQKYRDAAPDPKQAGSDLGVDHLLMGTMIADGSTLRISVQLVDLAGERVQWQDLFDAKLDNLLGVQDEIVSRLVDGMKVTLSPAEASHLRADVPKDREAFDLFLRAGGEPGTADGDRRAIDFLEQSLKKDSLFAPAWNALSLRQYDLALYSGGSPADYARAQETRRKALELNPDLTEALYSTGIQLVESGQHEEAYRTFKRRLSVKPSDAWTHFLLSYLFRYTALLPEAMREAERAIAIDPQNKQFRSGARIFLYAGAFDRMDPFLALDDSSWADYNRMERDVARGRADEARGYARKVIAADPNGTLSDYSRAALFVLDGETASARKIYEARLNQLSPDAEVVFNESGHFAWIGDYGRALELMKKAIDGGFFCYPAYENDIRMRGLRAQPGYAALREDAKRKSDAFRAFVEENP